MSDLFKRKSPLGLRTFIYVALSLFLLALNQHWSKFTQYRTYAAVTVAPVRYIVDWPIELIDWLGDSLSSKHALQVENTELRADELLLEARLEKLVALQKENDALKALLSSSGQVAGKVLMARLLAVNVNPGYLMIELNKGQHDRVYKGQPVVDGYGVIGQVVQAGIYSSQILLITDRSSAIPVQDNRNGLRAIAVGTGNNDLLSLVHVPDTADIKVGDILVSSGLAERYPVGYPVGVVIEVSHPEQQRFAKVLVKPSAHLNRSRQLLLVWPNKRVKHA